MNTSVIFITLSAAIFIFIVLLLFQQQRISRLQREQQEREDRRQRINLFIETANDLQGAVSTMRQSIPNAEIAATLSEATLSELQQIRDAISFARSEVTALENVFSPHLKTIATSLGLLPPQISTNGQKPSSEAK